MNKKTLLSLLAGGIVIGIALTVIVSEVTRAARRQAAVAELVAASRVAATKQEKIAAINKASAIYGENRSIFSFMTSAAHKNQTCNKIDDSVNEALDKVTEHCTTSDEDACRMSLGALEAVLAAHDKLNCGDDHQ